MAGRLVNYMAVFESGMITQEYTARGVITMVGGLRFDKDNPYTYAESKRLIKRLGDSNVGVTADVESSG